jgi:hypothetical protein
MRISNSLRFISVILAFVATGTTQAGVLATFDDLASPPPLNDKTLLSVANNNNSIYDGIQWDTRFLVIGDEYKLGSSSPFFGIPHSPHYYVTNGSDGASGLTITTGLVLTGAWFGRNQYYGFGAGADQVTIVALSGATQLSSVVFDLPITNPGLPEPLSFVNTGIFGTLSDITGYRIDRRDIGGGHWAADDFQFSNAFAVPEPGTLPLVLCGILYGLFKRKIAG